MCYKSIEEWQSELVWKDNLFLKRLRDAKLTDKQILDVINIIYNTCAHCYDGDNNCQCCNDE